MRHTGKRVAEAQPTPPRSKYRNVKVQVDGYTFDSKREAQYWQECRLREKAGDITELRRQVPFELTTMASDGLSRVVCVYLADMTFKDRDGLLHVVDAKGLRTQIYKLKAKWLSLSLGITIEEV